MRIWQPVSPILKGDILVAQGKKEEARAAYKAAVDALATATKPEAVHAA
jgi:predicted negative regulator of RcsB-dependent stress response